MKYLKPYNESIRDFLKPKSEEKVREEIKDMNWWKKMKLASKYDILWLAEELVNDKKYGADWSDLRQFLKYSCEEGSVNVVRYLLTLVGKVEDFDPSTANNICIWSTKNKEIFDMLLKTPKVYNSLSEYDRFRLGNKRLTLTESIRNVLKPKSEDDILKSIENLSEKDKLKNGLIYGIKWLVDDAKNKIGDDYLEINRDVYFATDDIENFSDYELEKIKDLINDPNSDREWSVVFVNGECEQFNIYYMEYGQIDYNEWVFRKKDGFYHIFTNIRVKGRFGQSYYITPTLNGLLKLIKDNNIKAKELEK